MIDSSKVMYVIDLYNKFRSPEAVASLVKVDEGSHTNKLQR
jgi:hypothetical protein